MLRIRPYILAGGRSSRMGQDKAMLPLAGRTLLGRAVDTLRAVPLLRDDQGQVTITVVGDRQSLEGADRAIPDLHPLCGPLGGMEAALADLEHSRLADWAFFIPVDMPFLPAPLLAALLAEWTTAASRGKAVCHVLADDRPQPLVSLLHRALHPFIAQALTEGRYKVTPVLQSAAALLASQDAGGILSLQSRVHHTSILQREPPGYPPAWALSEIQQRSHLRWFTNLNTADDVLEAETFLRRNGTKGS